MNGSIVTPELVDWANRVAARYSYRFRDAADYFGCYASEALASAAASYEPSGVYPFDRFARAIVRKRLNRVAARLARRVPVCSLSEDGWVSDRHSAPPDAPLEWDDYASSLLRLVTPRQAEVMRMMYLDCRGGSFARVARELGITPKNVHLNHSRAIARIRSRLAS